MNLHFRFTNLREQEKAKIEGYARKRFEHLERFLKSFQEDGKDLSVHVERFDKHNMYEVTCALKLGSHTVHHKEETHGMEEAIDLAEANLMRQTKKHVELLRGHEGKERRKEEDGEIEVNYDNIA